MSDKERASANGALKLGLLASKAGLKGKFQRRLAIGIIENEVSQSKKKRGVIKCENFAGFGSFDVFLRYLKACLGPS
jgi:hypothetical protein